MTRYKMPYEGIKVLDFTQALAGVFCAWQMADLGADVWKVERYGKGDISRTWGPFYNDLSVLYATFNRNKRSIAIDTARQEGRDLVFKLVKHVDVVLENFKVGTMEKLGIGYEELVKVNPNIIYGSIAGFGLEGPLKNLLCYDAVAAARSGLASQSGRPDGPPVKPGYSICDNWTGLNLFNAVGMALIEREKTGKGTRIDVAMTDAGFYISNMPILEYSAFGTIPQRNGNHDRYYAPYGEFEAKDGYVVLAVDSEDDWRKFCQLLGLESLSADPKYADNAQRCENRDALAGEIEKVTGTMGRKEIERLMTAHGIAAAAVMGIPEVMVSHHALDSGMVQVMEQKVIGSLYTPGIPIHFSKTPGEIRQCSPLLGEHSVEILQEAGFSQPDIDQLIAEKVVGVYEG